MMGGPGRYIAVISALVLYLMVGLPVADAADNPRERIDYWRSNYDEVSPQTDRLAARAHRVFARVLKAAGTRRGVVPRLFIIRRNTLEVIAIPDGWIILSRGALEFCYRDARLGDDRLAFVLGHEIAHQLKDDFWHMRFFQAIDAATGGHAGGVHEEVTGIIGEPSSKILAKELVADEYGAVYASIAGYDMQAVVSSDGGINFFAQWVRTMDPTRARGVHKDPTHPSPEQRAEVVRVRLHQVLEHVVLFQLGLWFYEAGDYERAILAFRKFLSYFPSREVYHNLAASHHQLALKHYRKWKGDKALFPFKLSLVVDPQTRASGIKFRGKGATPNHRALFEASIARAIALYKTAIEQDASYIPSYNNLACAMILQGDYYQAVGMLKKALKADADNAEAHNNLGIAFYYTENPAKAKEHLEKARQLKAKFDAPLFNLGRLAALQGDKRAAGKHWSDYVKQHAESPWANVARAGLGMKVLAPARPAADKTGAETVQGLQTGAETDDVPAAWGEPISREIDLEEEPFTLSTYANGIIVLSQDDEIRLILVPKGFDGKTLKGIRVGASGNKVLSAYGNPTEVMDLAQGQIWVYRGLGICFHFSTGKVKSWLLFES